MKLIEGSWDHYWMNQLNGVASKSKDPSRKVGAIITTATHEIVRTGFNGFSRGINDRIPERYERPLKYDYTVHAEHNAILTHARVGGQPLQGCKIYVNLFPCSDCANAIIQVGINKVITYVSQIDPNWDFNFSKSLLNEAGIEIIEYEN